MRVFVYGTLREGGPYHQLLGGAPCVGRVRTQPVYSLVSFGWYPGVVAGGQTAVLGELYTIEDPDQLARLDEYEGPWFYRDIIVLEDGSHAACWFVKAVIADERPHIESGDFMEESS